ncbi:class I SAM-dependent methyltransferase [Candidatus Pelagibacter sp.]|uniref:class I SAM-dependent methyltransferase n=1 Tax=Candidatus Pelagibacter sp. TaxID=2024849 RepID=UPI003F85A39F|tara:strand:+ start:145 stop:984 length:840 start_codon:yes stop_codon:yes gene_type:complete
MNNFFKLNYNNYFIQKFSTNKKLRNFKNNLYWKDFKNFKDPDGKLRNLSIERKKKLIDLKNEISFIKNKFKNRKCRIIDLGSGFGFFLSAFGKNWEKHGIELSDLASHDSKKWSKIHKIDLEKKITISDMKKLGKFDVVFSYHVIEHLKNPNQFILNARELLKDNGIFILGTPNFDSGCARLFKKKYRFFHDKTHITFFSENSLYRLFDDYGFEVFNVDYPYFETYHFNLNNLKKLFNKKQVSPPFYGNIMTFYTKKRSKKSLKDYLKYKTQRFKKLIK